MKARNGRRRAQEFQRTYGGEERVRKMKARPCAVPGCTSRSETVNAHLPSRSGMGRKGHARHVVPLCGIPHHREFDCELARDVEAFDRRHGTDLRALAARLAEEDGVV